MCMGCGTVRLGSEVPRAAASDRGQTHVTWHCPPSVRGPQRRRLCGLAELGAFDNQRACHRQYLMAGDMGAWHMRLCFRRRPKGLYSTVVLSTVVQWAYGPIAAIGGYAGYVSFQTVR